MHFMSSSLVWLPKVSYLWSGSLVLINKKVSWIVFFKFSFCSYSKRFSDMRDNIQSFVRIMLKLLDEKFTKIINFIFKCLYDAPAAFNVSMDEKSNAFITNNFPNMFQTVNFEDDFLCESFWSKRRRLTLRIIYVFLLWCISHKITWKLLKDRFHVELGQDSSQRHFPIRKFWATLRCCCSCQVFYKKTCETFLNKWEQNIRCWCCWPNTIKCSPIIWKTKTQHDGDLSSYFTFDLKLTFEMMSSDLVYLWMNIDFMFHKQSTHNF